MALKIIPVVQLIIAMVIAYLLSLVFPQCNLTISYLPFIISLIIIIAATIAVVSIVHFKKANTTVHPARPQTTAALVQSGIYSFSRNPMYLAMVLVLFAFNLSLANWMAFLSLFIFITYLTKYQIMPEEEVLKNLFGESFEQYRKKVRRWL